ncbi:MAG: aldo/keto reductase [Alphaproteobacteria bacterium]|nr:aldo/keto reductase [Alphaproteobacteria bacterium]
MLTTISGQPISRFSFGTMQFGGNADETDSAQMYDACRKAGINVFDTAHGYNDGRSEEFTGRLIAGERDDVFVATKCGYRGWDPDRMHAEFAESRKRLGQDVVDLLYIHQWDPDGALEDALAVIGEYALSGATRYVGVSNFAAWKVMKARQIARDMGFDVQFLQPMYNLVKRQAEVEILPMAVSEDFTVCPYSPLGGGLLTGKYAAGVEGRLTVDDRYNARYGPEWMRKSATDLAELAAVSGVSPATLAVAWAARHPGVWGPIISARNAIQLMPSLAAMTFEMDDELYAEVSALSPAPPPDNDRLEEA